MNQTDRPTRDADSRRMLTFRSGGWVILLAAILPILMVAILLIVNRDTLTQRAVGDGRNIESYGFDLSNCLVPRELIVAAGPDLRKDGLPVPTNPATIAANGYEHGSRLGGVRKLVPSDRVIGVEISGQARAYPLWIMAWHEIVNDELGAVPIVVTYSPLGDAVVVFDRRVDGETLDFGVSGLLYNSNLLMYDRRPGSVGESLWSQLQFRAIAGPAAERAQSLAIIPASLVPWSAWRAEHPDTTIMLPTPGRKRLYQRDPYATYFISDKLRFPVAPPPPPDGWPLKARVTCRRTPTCWEVIRADAPAGADDAGRSAHVHALWFAWYAMHPEAEPRRP